MSSTTLRCAVYTRKSSEEGLEQAFNSLDAQREAGLDYIRSQKHQGWKPIETEYDDGGYSGGTTERPGLQRLLKDIKRGSVDVVVVYKVDRLSRSLADFARLMQLFDEHKVSFVSVTQQFNTTTSMGRLTLNMLLSFAQFEREVTGERIRDKIAATKRKGAWVTGQPPLGYRVAKRDEGDGQRRLLIVEEDAVIVRAIFSTYLKTRSFLAVVRTMKAAGHTTRKWESGRGIPHGGKPFTPVKIHKILTNPVYIGKITHTSADKTDIFEGLHEPLIERSMWDEIQTTITLKATEHKAVARWTHTHLLRGKVRTHENYAMSPSSVLRTKKRANGVNQRRILYYCSQKALRQGYGNCEIKMLNAQYLDDLVRSIVLPHLRTHHDIDLQRLDSATRDHWIRETLHRVVVGPDQLVIELRQEQVGMCLQYLNEANHSAANGALSRKNRGVDNGSSATVYQSTFTPRVSIADGVIALTLNILIKKHNNRRILVSPSGSDLFLTRKTRNEPAPQEHLVQAIGQAFALHREHLKAGGSIDGLRKQFKIARGRIEYLMQLTQLSPAVVSAVLTGRLTPSVTLRDLHAAARHLDWSLQVAELMLETR